MSRVIVPSDQLDVDMDKRHAFNAWLEEHDVEPKVCFKVELVTTPGEDEDDWMVVHCYKLNEDGAKYVLGAGELKTDPLPVGWGKPAVEPPRTVTLHSPMPELT